VDQNIAEGDRLRKLGKLKRQIFVRRVARTPHYDGVKKGEAAPAVIGIFGQAPIDLKLVDPAKPLLRAV
jgi:hypothetical protein